MEKCTVTENGSLEIDVPNCVLTDDEFNRVCQLSTDGQIKQLSDFVSAVLTKKECRVGPKTFCPDPADQKTAPFVLSAQYGRKEIVEYFLDRHGDVVDIDHVATIVSLTTKKKVHCATALWAASTGGHLDIVQLLIARGAKVNKPTLTQSTPLRGASFHGHLEVMEYLLSSGAEINMPNCIGQSPLCIAAMRGQLEAVKYLIDRGADTQQATINGYSVMHLSATKGRVDIVQYLLSIGLSPQFQEADPSVDGYIPCPLYLAASTGQKHMVEELIVHKDCIPACKSDALLLLGSTRCEISHRGLTMGSRDLWIKGLEIRESSDLQVKFLPPIDSYGNRVEVRDQNDLSELSTEPNFNRYEAYFQNLIIRERCMGYGDQGLIYFLIRRGMWFCSTHLFSDAELLWHRAMEMEIKICEMEISNARYGHSEGLQRDLEKDLSQYASGIWHMVENGYRPDFNRYVRFGFKELEILQYLREKAENAIFIDIQIILGIMLYMFASWLHYDTMAGDGDRPEGSLCSEECEKLGTEFVQRYLYALDGSSLLHYALTDFSILEDEETIYCKFPSLAQLIDALLHWGADEVLNKLDSNGQRPIHVAVDVANDFMDMEVRELVSPLVSGGAHMDAVDHHGRTALECCQSEIVKLLIHSSGPLPLVCHCANHVVKEELPYQSIGLPQHIVNFVQLHDKNFSLPQK